METQEMSKQMIGYQKQVLDGWHAATALMANQAEASINWMLDTAVWMPDEGRRAVVAWMTHTRAEHERLKTHLDRRLAAAEKIFAADETPRSAKTKRDPIKKKKETTNEAV